MYKTNVVGVTKGDDKRQDTIRKYIVKDMEVDLVREPGNPFDDNAIAVKVFNKMTGYIPASIAKKIAPELDKGIKMTAIVTGKGKGKRSGNWSYNVEITEDEEASPVVDPIGLDLDFDAKTFVRKEILWELI